MSEYDNIDVFNAAAAAIFDFLLGNFPIYMDIHSGVLKEALDPYLVTAQQDVVGSFAKRKGETYILTSNVTVGRYVPEVVKWLHAEGYLQHNEKQDSYQLSSMALSVLNSTPTGLSEPLRARLSAAVQAGASEAGKVAMGEVVGQIMGAAARTFIGSPG